MKLDDALDSMTARDLVELAAEVEKRLLTCVLCQGPHAERYLLRGSGRVNGANRRGSLMLCTPCFEKHRRPKIAMTDE